MGKEVIITAANFDAEVTNSDVPVLIDFWADWCAPCKMIAPVLDELAEDYAGRLKVAKLDVDAEPDLAANYNVVSIPTLLLIKDGTVVNQHVGAGPRPVLEAIFRDHIS
jgi:thioredoxin 1